MSSSNDQRPIPHAGRPRGEAWRELQREGIEWEGQVGRANSGGGPGAVPLRETVLRADATRVEDWQWRSDDVVGYAYDSHELAAHCVDSLAYALQDRAR